MNYFAYGSNMDEARMKERQCLFSDAQAASLLDWKLVFDKQSQKMPEVGFGNVEPDKGSLVEGILYTLNDTMITVLDKYEGHPKHYTRQRIKVTCKGKEVEADIYIANKNWVKEGLKPSKDYLDHFLAGKEFLSESYYENLKKTPTTL